MSRYKRLDKYIDILNRLGYLDVQFKYRPKIPVLGFPANPTGWVFEWHIIGGVIVANILSGDINYRDIPINTISYLDPDAEKIRINIVASENNSSI